MFQKFHLFAYFQHLNGKRFNGQTNNMIHERKLMYFKLSSYEQEQKYFLPPYC